MVFRFKCFEILFPETEIDNTLDGQTKSSSSQGGCKSSQTKSSSAQSYYSANADFVGFASECPNNLEVFTYRELQQATDNFCPSSKIGEGDFGSIYKGVIQYPNKKLHVMVKLLNERYIQGHSDWAMDAKDIGLIKHPNLVKLVGYGAKDNKRGCHRVLVYEYFRNGSVRDRLSTGVPLPWTVRLNIAQDAAYCLAYLHGAMNSLEFIFGNFKSSNVFLDSNWNAKLFYSFMDQSCLSKGLRDVSITTVGNSCYDAPEYSLLKHATSMSDVWNYGVFLCELITGRCPFDQTRPKNEQKMVEWVKPYLTSTRCIGVVDLRLAGNFSLQSVEKLSKVAKRCLADNPKARPPMIKVLDMVNQVLIETTMEAKGQKRWFINRKPRRSGCLSRLCSSKLEGSPERTSYGL